MNLYLCADGTYAGTQADARAKGPGWKAEEVPTDKAGLIEYLNNNRHLHELECPDPEAHKRPAVDLQATGDAYLRGQEVAKAAEPPIGPLSMIAVEEAIQAAGPVELASYASNVAWRFKELGKELARV